MAHVLSRLVDPPRLRTTENGAHETARLAGRRIVSSAGTPPSRRGSLARWDGHVEDGHDVVAVGIEGERARSRSSLGSRDGRGRHRRRRGPRGAYRRGRARRPGQAGHRPRAGAGGEPRRAGVLVARRPLHGRHAGAAAHGDPRLARARLAGLARKRRLRPRRGPLAASLGRGVRGLRRRREARVASGDGASHLPGRRLGRAGRRQRDRPRQLGAALPPHLGNRPRRAGADRAPGARRSRPRPRDAPLPPPGRRPRRLGRQPCWRPRRAARAEHGGAGRGELACRGRRVLALGLRRDRHVGRHRRRPRPRSGELAGAARQAAGAHGRGGPCPRRRPHARDLGGRRRERREPRPHVALRRGSAQLEPRVDEPRHPHPARPVVALARRARTAPAGPAVPRVRHPRDARARHALGPRAHLVRAHAADHREGVRALRLRAEPRPHEQERTPGPGPRTRRRAWPGGRVQAERRRLRRGRHAARARPAA